MITRKTDSARCSRRTDPAHSQAPESRVYRRHRTRSQSNNRATPDEARDSRGLDVLHDLAAVQPGLRGARLGDVVIAARAAPVRPLLAHLAVLPGVRPLLVRERAQRQPRGLRFAVLLQRVCDLLWPHAVSVMQRAGGERARARGHTYAGPQGHEVPVRERRRAVRPLLDLGVAWLTDEARPQAVHLGAHGRRRVERQQPEHLRDRLGARLAERGRAERDGGPVAAVRGRFGPDQKTGIGRWVMRRFCRAGEDGRGELEGTEFA